MQAQNFNSPPKHHMPHTGVVMPRHPEERVVPQVELRVSCKGLPKLDTMSKSDPMCVLERRTLDGAWAEAGRTERISNCHEPSFMTAFKVDYHFEERQELRFSLYDADSKSAKLSKQDFIGSYYTTLGEVMVSPGCAMSGRLVDPGQPNRDRGTITVRGEQLAAGNLHVSCQLRGERLDNKDKILGMGFFGKTDGYIVIHKSREAGGYTPVYKSEVVKNSLNPTWRPLEINAADLCNSDLDRPILFEVLDHDTFSADDTVGHGQTTLRSLSEGHPVELINPKKVSRKGYRNSGVIHPVRCELTRLPSFLDYIAGGCEMNLMVAVDFTASNGNPQNPSSLHYHSAGAPNEYQRALSAVTRILLDYDSDGLIPAYGFGAQLPPHAQTSHAFALNGNPQNPSVHGVEGLMEAYDQALQSVTLHGPTVFSQVLRLAASHAAGVTQHQQRYTILLVLTDGEVTDMTETLRTLREATRTALSVVIVGVGAADFGKMETLDGDGPGGIGAGVRDIVQFVPFRRYAQMHESYLAKEVLREIPGQMLEFFRTAGIRPNPPRQAITSGGPPPAQMPHPHQPHPGMLNRMGSSGHMVVPPRY